MVFCVLKKDDTPKIWRWIFFNPFHFPVYHRSMNESVTMVVMHHMMHDGAWTLGTFISDCFSYFSQSFLSSESDQTAKQPPKVSRRRWNIGLTHQILNAANQYGIHGRIHIGNFDRHDPLHHLYSDEDTCCWLRSLQCLAVSMGDHTFKIKEP